MDLNALIEREIASSMNEQRDAVRNTITDFFESIGETASAQNIEVRNLNATSVVLSGEGVTEQAATFLRGAGFDVIHSGEIAVVKTKRRRMNSTRGGKGNAKLGELKFFNDTKSVNAARKMFTELVEATDWRFFPQFLKDIDNVIVNARLREGHPADDDEAEPSNPDGPALLDRNDSRAVASAEDEGDDKAGNAADEGGKEDVAAA